VQTESAELSSESFVLPASFAQQRMWFLDRLEANGAVYNVPTVTRLRGPLDVDALERAISAVVERHESLRTVFTLVDGVPHQLIRPPAPVALETIDLRGEPDAEPRALDLVAAHAGEAFDLSSDELLRVGLIKLGDQDHVLSLTLHHIITDGWSVGVVNREIAELYGAFLAGRDAELPELPIQYADYAVWQQQWMESGGLDQQLEYWTQKLAGAPTLLEIPTDKPRPSEQSFRGATLRTVLPLPLLQRLSAFGESQGSTMFMVLLSAFAALLSRYSDQDDVVVATPVANRNRVELEQLIGLLVNTLAVRVQLGDDPSFAELLRSVRETALEAFSNQDVPFERLVQELNPDRNRSHAPVAQVLFVFQNAAEHPATLAGLEHERVPMDRGTAKFDLALIAGEVPDGLRLAIEYCSDLFEEATIQRMLQHFETLLEGIVAEPDRPVSELRLLPDDERELVLSGWNSTDPGRPPDQCVHELVADQARRSPDAVAVQFGAQRLTYADLDARANRLGAYLQELGVGPDTVVGICAERSLEMVVAVLGVLKAGGAYAPIDPAYPAERVKFMLADCDTPVLLTQQHLLSRLPHREARTVCLDSEWDAIAGDDDAPPESAVTLDHLAYVLYTSGSTGQPKGVAMGHRALANMIAWQLGSWSPPGPARTLQFASLSFDVAFQEIFSTWCSGGTLVLIDEPLRRDPESLLALLSEERVERLFLPFVALQNLCEAAEHLDRTVPTLRDVITAGEQLKTTPTLRRFFAAHPHCALLNHYGPTESHVVTAFRLTGTPDQWPPLPPIGRPITGATIRLLDRHLQPVPIGVPGELCVGGVSLARGYLNRPELTIERFVPDPFAGEPGARLYRTGDLARYLPDGNLQYLGRIDHQVKVRGYRIEPGEVEAALRDHPAVREALVTARDDDRGGRLVAYLRTDEPAPGAAELHDLLLGTLPAYMVPSAFVTLDAFPLTPNGKLDRRALPAPDDSARVTAEYVPPSTDIERSLAEVWAELLKVHRVGLHDNFFALGGHSLLAVRLISRIRDRLGIEVALSTIFDSPTVAGLAEAVERADGHESSTAQRPIGAAPRELRRLPGSADPAVVLPASYAEQRLWFLDRLEPDNVAYNVPLAVRLGGRLDVEALTRALGALVRRHESLRTTFAVIDGAPQQVIAPPGAVPLAISDVTARPDPEDAARRLVGEAARAGFDLENGPLLRAALIRVAADDHILIITLHHIIIDGWSIGVFNRELSSLYHAFHSGQAPALAEPAIQYGDFAVWQQEWMRSGGLDQQLDYWQQRLAGAPALLELPTDRPRPARQSFRGAVVRRALAPEQLERLKQLGEQEGTTLFMTLLAAFMALLSRYSGQQDIVVASPVANRNRVELEGLIGFFVNTLPLRVEVDDDPSFRELLGRVRETALGAFSNQDLPFEKLVEELNPDRQLSFPPLAQVSFVLNAVDGPLQLTGLQAGRVPGARRTTKFDLGLFAAETSEGLRLSVEYSTDLFDETTIERILSHYENLVGSALAQPALPVSELRLLDEPERQAAISSSAATEVEYPVACLHELFERQASETPETTAASFAGACISYDELNRRANRLAHRLRELGAGPGSLVALLLEPSFETLTAILGVLKAGAAYVPLDPEYPAERLAFVLSDTQAPVVVTSAQLLDRLPADQLHVVFLDPEDQALAGQSTTNPDAGAKPEDLAYVIYTSGSTGRPKGVQVEHRQVARLFSATDAWYGFGARDTWMLLHSYAFDFSVWELWGALAHGGRLVISPRLTTRTPEALAELVADQQVTVLNATPSLFLGVQEELLRRADRLALRLVIFGGEALEPPALRPWFARYGDSGPALVNMYGITETTVHVTYRPVGAADCDTAASPIGAPIPDLSLYLLDRHGEPVPAGVAGELFVGGAGVARGYLNRPDLTAERFIDSPFGPGRLYRTGDVARRLPGGELDFRGRIDDQVKIRGFRIELGEIRATLGAHPAVAEAVVLASKAQAGDARLVAYVVAVDGADPPGADELRAWLAERLPGYMIPAGWVFLDGLPLTRNGKLDVKALPEPEYNRTAVTKEFTAPATETERHLARIWSDVLGVGQIGVHDSFFELGGHSMLAVRLFAEIERKLGARLPLSALFESATIAGLADLIERDRRDEIDWSTVVQLRAGEDRTPLFLVAWAGGEVLPYRDLAEALGSDLPVFGLRAPGVDGRTPPLARVEELAAHYVSEMRRVQPSGPYQVAGFCFSGLVAYEMTRQLIQQGETVGLLALIDAYPWQPRRQRSRVQAERVKLQAFKATDLRGKRSWIGNRVRALRNRVSDLVYIRVGPRVYARLAVRNLHRRLPRRPWNLVLIASNLARIRYVPTSLDVRVDFFRAQTAADERPTPWDGVAGQGVHLRQIVAPGIQHERMMHEPYVELLAAEFTRAIAGAAEPQTP
jgi:amino acid adenylation domain-containing protein